MIPDDDAVARAFAVLRVFIVRMGAAQRLKDLNTVEAAYAALREEVFDDPER